MRRKARIGKRFTFGQLRRLGRARTLLAGVTTFLVMSVWPAGAVADTFNLAAQSPSGLGGREVIVRVWGTVDYYVGSPQDVWIYYEVNGSSCATSATAEESRGASLAGHTPAFPPQFSNDPPEPADYTATPKPPPGQILFCAYMVDPYGAPDRVRSQVITLAQARALVNTGPPNGTVVFETDLPLTTSWALGQNQESWAIEFKISSSPPDLSQFGAPTRRQELQPGAVSSPTLTIGPGYYQWQVQVRDTAADKLIYGPVGTFTVLDSLSAAEARDITRRLIAERAHLAAKITRLRCRSKSVVKAKCRFAAFLGDTIWRGRGIVFFSTVPEDNLHVNHFRFSVKRINAYCQATGRRKCVKHRRWRN